MICVDSDCIIDFLKGTPQAVQVVEHHKAELVTTEISRFEVLFGIYSQKQPSLKEELAARSFFDSIQVLPLLQSGTESAAKILGNLARAGKIIEQNDALIAGIMVAHECTKILTRNVAHFRRIPELGVISY